MKEILLQFIKLLLNSDKMDNTVEAKVSDGINISSLQLHWSSELDMNLNLLPIVEYFIR